MKNIYILAMSLLCVSTVVSQQHIDFWGDQGNGTYINPILNADYSDPDVIRVGDTYYMVASDFHFLGMQVLASKDMINWRLISKVYERFDFPGWDTNERYAGGSWAPAIRYHDNKYWIFFCTPHEGLFMTNASKAEGPWSPLVRVSDTPMWEDPCPFWDDDGNAYLGRSQHGAGPIIIHRMSPDGTKLLDEGRVVYTGPVAEGTKIHKLNGYYYLSIPEGGVETGWQTILRSKSIYGPYEKRVVLEQGLTDVNGPHQGAIVDTPYGEWWFFHFQQYKTLGRVVHLQPMHWKDGWPVIGVDRDMNGIGEPVKTWIKPACGKPSEIVYPNTTDYFDSDTLGLQWQTNHNPTRDSALAIEHNKLVIRAHKAPSFKKARNTLTQKIMGYRVSITASMEWTDETLVNGINCGMACMGRENYTLGIVREGEKSYICLMKDESIIKRKVFTGHKVYLRLETDAVNNSYNLLYSADNVTYETLSDSFAMRWGHWKGVRAALYCYNSEDSKGEVAFDDFMVNIVFKK